MIFVSVRARRTAVDAGRDCSGVGIRRANGASVSRNVASSCFCFVLSELWNGRSAHVRWTRAAARGSRRTGSSKFKLPAYNGADGNSVAVGRENLEAQALVKQRSSVDANPGIISFSDLNRRLKRWNPIKIPDNRPIMVEATPLCKRPDFGAPGRWSILPAKQRVGPRLQIFLRPFATNRFCPMREQTAGRSRRVTEFRHKVGAMPFGPADFVAA